MSRHNATRIFTCQPKTGYNLLAHASCCTYLTVRLGGRFLLRGITSMTADIPDAQAAGELHDAGLAKVGHVLAQVTPVARLGVPRDLRLSDGPKNVRGNGCGGGAACISSPRVISTTIGCEEATGAQQCLCEGRGVGSGSNTHENNNGDG